MEARIGVIGRADYSGLGQMTEQFLRNSPDPIDSLGLVTRSAKPYDPAIAQHVKHASVLGENPSDIQIRNFVADLDVVIGFETFYNDHAIGIAEKAGCKTVVFPMWECSPDNVIAADLIVAVTEQDARTYPTAVHLDWPICRRVYKPQSNVRFVPKDQADKIWTPSRFVCNAGFGGLNNRNNVDAVIKVAGQLKSVLTIGMRSCKPTVGHLEYPGIEWLPPAPAAELYDGVDVLVHLHGLPPLSLPILEAAAARIPTIVMDVEGFEAWPEQMRITVDRYEILNIGPRELKYARPDIDHLRDTIFGLKTGKITPACGPQPATWPEFNAKFFPLIEALTT